MSKKALLFLFFLCFGASIWPICAVNAETAAPKSVIATEPKQGGVLEPFRTSQPFQPSSLTTVQQKSEASRKAEEPSKPEVLPGPARLPTAENVQQSPVELSPLEKIISSKEKGAEDPQPQSAQASELIQFGYNFFRPSAPGFSPLTDVPVGADYPIGPGDRIIINLWGSVEGTHELEVNRSGEILLPRVGGVKVWGVTFGKLHGVIKSSLSRAFKDFDLNVTMGKLRIIKVYVVGEVRSPGDYNLTPLSTLINALSAAGGPLKSGTLRNIQIKRGGTTVDTVDLYNFFLTGDKSRDIRLQPGDTIFVPAIGPAVGIAGNVRRAAIYELKGEKTLADVLALAGGINPTGYLQRVQIARVEAHEKRIISDFSLDPKNAGTPNEELTGSIKVQDLDLVRVFPIDNTLRGYVRLDGHVLRPGDYALKPGMKVADLIGRDNLLQDHHADAALVTRLAPPDYRPEKLFINLEKAMSEDNIHNLALQEFDVVRVYSRRDMEESSYVSVSGEIQRPGRYLLTKNQTVSDLVKEAGNLKKIAFTKKAEIRRVRVDGDVLKPYSIYIDLEEALKGNPRHNIILNHLDELVIKKYDISETRVVRINGEVQRPGEYRFVENMTIADLVMEAGGLRKTAYSGKAEVTRVNIQGDSITTFTTNLDLEKALQGDPKENISLMQQDTVIIRRIPNWFEETERYVTLRGEFLFPGVYPAAKGEKLDSVIKRAGGFTERAYLRGAKFTRVSIKETQQKRMDELVAKAEQEILKKQSELASVASSREELEATKATLEGLKRTVDRLKTAEAEGRLVIKLESLELFGDSTYNVVVQGGDVLEVPQTPSSVNVLGQVYNPIGLVPIENEDVAYYLAKAGGPTTEANESDIFVVKIDGTVISRQQSSFLSSLFFSGFMSETMEPGDTIVVPQEFEKIAWMREIKDITTILGQIALSAGVLIAAEL